MHNFDYDVLVKQITVRKVHEKCLEKAKHLARVRGVAMNTVLVEALETGLGLEGMASKNGLERYAGDSDFGDGWDAHLEELRRVNPEDWK